jgi:hypothetical protein
MQRAQAACASKYLWKHAVYNRRIDMCGLWCAQAQQLTDNRDAASRDAMQPATQGGAVVLLAAVCILQGHRL